MPIAQSPNHPIAQSPPVMPARDTGLRLNDFYEVYRPADPAAAQAEGGRCFNCGAAFCMPDSGYGAPGSSPGSYGCPIHNKIPEWNELVRLGRWREAYDRLSDTNPFPEFTSRVCPAPCQDACILGINEDPVQIKGIERAIIDRAFDEGWVKPPSVSEPSGRRVAIIGSGPAGLTAADTLIRQGHAVTVYERSDRPGGLLTYGVPNMKLDKQAVQRRVDLLEAGGVHFRCNTTVGLDITADQLRQQYDAVLLAIGAQRARPLDLPGRDLIGVIPAMDYLTAATQTHLGSPPKKTIDANDADVIVIGGGDTGADCIGTALRQGCRSMLNITRREQPGDQRDAAHPWPGAAETYTLDYAHAEGVEKFGRDPREFQVQPVAFVADESDPTRMAGVRVRHLDTGEEQTLPARFALISIGFVGHDSSPLTEAFGLEESRGQLQDEKHRTAQPGIYVAGDCRRGASLVVWAIREGLDAAAAIHDDLMSPRTANAAVPSGVTS